MATPARPGVARRSIMDRKWLCLLGIVAVTAGAGAQQFAPGGGPATEATAPQRWLGPDDRNLTTDGSVLEVPLPNAGSAPTTIAIAQDGIVWFTESAGNRIGRMKPDGTNLQEFA